MRKADLLRMSRFFGSIALLILASCVPVFGSDQASKSALHTPASHTPAIKLQMPMKRNAGFTSSQRAEWRTNTLLVMPFDAGSEDSQNLVKDLDGTVCSTIGDGDMTVWVVTFDSASDFTRAEKALSENKLIGSVQRDYLFHSTLVTNDPYFSQAWHLPAMNIPAAWDSSLGGNCTIAVIDTGVDPSNLELQNKLYQGYDSVARKVGQTPVHVHGTMVATTAAALADNNNAGAGPARLSSVFPVRAGDYSFTAGSIINAINHIGNNTSAKIINMSLNGVPPYTIANPSINGALHKYLTWFHDTKGGLIFNAAGNDHLEDTNALVPYLIVVSAMDESYNLASFSNYGNCIWFTAPGRNIFCTSKYNTIASASGTSFSSPLACSVAALVWGAKPALSNIQVEKILKDNSTNAGSGWNKFFGYGLIDAAGAVTQALATTPAPPPSPVASAKKPKKKQHLGWYAAGVRD